MYKYTQEQPYTYRNAIMIMVFSVDPCALVSPLTSFVKLLLCKRLVILKFCMIINCINCIFCDSCPNLLFSLRFLISLSTLPPLNYFMPIHNK